MSVLDEFFPRRDGEKAAEVMAAAKKGTITWEQYRAAHERGIEIRKKVRVTGVPCPPPTRRRSVRYY